jgi:hypothetical protein
MTPSPNSGQTTTVASALTSGQQAATVVQPISLVPALPSLNPLTPLAPAPAPASGVACWVQQNPGLSWLAILATYFAFGGGKGSR